MIGQAAILVMLPLGLLGLVALPLGLVQGPHQWLCAACAYALTVPAGLATLLVSAELSKSSPWGKVTGVFVGTFIRLFVGLGGGVAVFLGFGATFRSDPVSYWLWLLGAYLLSLIVETTLLNWNSRSK